MNELGKEYTTAYQFETSEDLDAAAAYIVGYGLGAFNEAVEAAIEEAVSRERQFVPVSTGTTTPTTCICDHFEHWHCERSNIWLGKF